MGTQQLRGRVLLCQPALRAKLATSDHGLIAGGPGHKSGKGDRLLSHSARFSNRCALCMQVRICRSTKNRWLGVGLEFIQASGQKASRLEGTPSCTRLWLSSVGRDAPTTLPGTSTKPIPCARWCLLLSSSHFRLEIPCGGDCWRPNH